MSAGVFAASIYGTDTGQGLPCRIQPETISAFNPASAVTVVPGVGRIRLSNGRRQFGISPRTVSGTWLTPPSGYQAGGSVKIPILTLTTYQAIVLGATLTYLGGTFKVVGKTPEKEN